MNTINLIGRLTRTPRVTHTGDKTRTTFTLAVDSYTRNDENTLTKVPAYVPVTCFGKLAESVAEYTDKGHLVAVEGRIASGKYTNDQGETVYTLDVIGNRVTFLKAPKSTTTTPDSVDSEEEAA